MVAPRKPAIDCHFFDDFFRSPEEGARRALAGRRSRVLLRLLQETDRTAQALLRLPKLEVGSPARISDAVARAVHQAAGPPRTKRPEAREADAKRPSGPDTARAEGFPRLRSARECPRSGPGEHGESEGPVCGDPGAGTGDGKTEQLRARARDRHVRAAARAPPRRARKRPWPGGCGPSLDGAACR